MKDSRKSVSFAPELENRANISESSNQPKIPQLGDLVILPATELSGNPAIVPERNRQLPAYLQDYVLTHVWENYYISLVQPALNLQISLKYHS